MKRLVVVFDFDGTLTTKDTLLEFIKFACGTRLFYIGFILHLHLLVLMKLNLYPNWKCKEKIFAWFFRGIPYSRFKQLGEDFSLSAKRLLRADVVNLLYKYLNTESRIYVVSASIEEWVLPLCRSIGIEYVLATKIEVDSHNNVTGRFLSKNCYGKEKVNRLLTMEPNREEYVLHAYGDSRGDREMLDFADKGTLV